MSSKRILKILAFCILFLIVVLAIDGIYQPFVQTFPYSKFTGHSSYSKRNKEQVVNRLQHQVDDLKKMLDMKTKQLEKAKQTQISSDEIVHSDDFDLFSDGDSILHFVNDKMQNSQILRGSSRTNEYDVNPFFLFNRQNIYTLKPGLSRKTQVPWTRMREDKQELSEVISEGLRNLNGGTQAYVSPTYRFTEKDFLHGIYRTENGVGTQYKLVFRPQSSKNLVDKHQLFEIDLFRPYAPLRRVGLEMKREDEVVHFIIPLTKRSDTFRVFISFFKELIEHDKNVRLIVAFYGEEAADEVTALLDSFHKDTGFSNYSLVTSNEEFSRGRALHLGLNSIKTKNPLLFFCDVDMAFTPDFLNQCRAHTSPGKSVFFPIVFSLYNPELVYEGATVPDLKLRQHIKRTHGFWRDFGFGMSCMYFNDYKQSGGFDLSITGWGMEDMLLYRKFAKSSIKVVRSPVNSLFHHWHPKVCDKSWSSEQYHSCLKSRITTEGSSLQLGLQYFRLKDILDSQKKP